MCDASLNESACLESVKSTPVKELLLSDKTVMSSPSCVLPENRAKALAALQKQHSFDFVCGCSTSCAKALLARFAAVINVPMLTDVVNVVDKTTFQRYVYAGNALETVSLHSSPLVSFSLLCEW